jgi:hypothetical protein
MIKIVCFYYRTVRVRRLHSVRRFSILLPRLVFRQFRRRLGIRTPFNMRINFIQQPRWLRAVHDHFHRYIVSRPKINTFLFIFLLLLLAPRFTPHLRSTKKRGMFATYVTALVYTRFDYVFVIILSSYDTHYVLLCSYEEIGTGHCIKLVIIVHCNAAYWSCSPSPLEYQNVFYTFYFYAVHTRRESRHLKRTFVFTRSTNINSVHMLRTN